MFVWPILQQGFSISLEQRQIGITVEGVDKNRIKLAIKASINFKVRGDEEGVRRAAQRFLSQQATLTDEAKTALVNPRRAAVRSALSNRAFGQEASFAELILVNTLVALFAGLMPIPGNIGVSEAALTYGLTALGIPQTAALSAAIVYRMATFYLPPIWGFLSMRYLRKHSYL